MNLVHRGILVAFPIVVFHTSILAYAPLGHEIVGAIADERLANTPTAAKVYRLLHGLTLEKAARGTGNLMPPLIEAVRARATIGEICDTLQNVFGLHEQV